MKHLFSVLIILFTVHIQGQIITTPPQFSHLRAMAEWEEVQALTIAWTDFPAILKKIVAAARLETQVIILTDDPQSTEDYLMSSNTGGAAFSNMDNVTLLDGSYDSIWMRDYAANPVYGNEVDSLIMVDWMYNRPRPNDDSSPETIANSLGLDLYATSSSPYDLRYTGGNYMSDGFGTAFASELILEENDGDGDYNISYPTHSVQEINDILNSFMGIDTYIKMPTLPYDGIHHIDMHMKLVNEETILVSEYPDGVADGPQINANIEYVLNNYDSKFGTPYNVVRIPAPNSTGGLYPDNGGSYRTYTNAVFVNNSILFPTYREEFDTIAYRIWGEVCPGYTLVGIDCDDQGNNIISQSGAIHCITHAIGVADPLLISHQPLDDTYDAVNPYSVVAYMNHRDGINTGTLYWRITGAGAFNEVEMNPEGANNWQASIPPQPVGSIIEYYVEGEANTGKIQVRPLPAPVAFWTFEILGIGDHVNEINRTTFGKVFPNPANAITCIEINCKLQEDGVLYLTDILGQKTLDIFSGTFRSGTSKYFFDASTLVPGVYQLILQSKDGVNTFALMVK